MVAGLILFVRRSRRRRQREADSAVDGATAASLGAAAGHGGCGEALQGMVERAGGCADGAAVTKYWTGCITAEMISLACLEKMNRALIRNGVADRQSKSSRAASCIGSKF